MTPTELAALIGGIGGPTVGIVAAVIAFYRARRETGVSHQSVHVDEKEAHTAEIAMIIDGFTQSLEAVRAQLRDTRLELEAVQKKHDALAARVDHDGKQRVQMIQHIQALEALIPNPPGPPERPAWD